ncbi:MAG: hypothetical protein AAGH87_09090 [Pseudomonadota bacterium]
MNLPHHRAVAALAAALALAAPAAADGPLRSELTAFIVTVDEDGAEMFEQVDEVEPGDLVEYRLVYTNTSEAPLEGLVVSAPVPASTDLVLGSETTQVPGIFEASIDEGANWGAPPIFLEPGTEADIDDYDLVRWSPETAITPGEEWLFAYRVSVE